MLEERLEIDEKEEKWKLLLQVTVLYKCIGSGGIENMEICSYYAPLLM